MGCLVPSGIYDKVGVGNHQYRWGLGDISVIDNKDGEWDGVVDMNGGRGGECGKFCEVRRCRNRNY